jgi:biopolymer transport protein TolR
MGMDAGISQKGARSGINVTPLIDVVLVLLIIFMVMTPSMLKHVTMKIPPKAPDAPSATIEPPPLIVAYTARRELSINSEPVAWEAVGSTLAERLRTRAQKVVFFQVDDDVSYGDSVRLMDTARGAGAKVLALAPRN